jgi:ectoine hydroxylase-related dioxygenase (phytanoyl-CoA dioxygenase family)
MAKLTDAQIADFHENGFVVVEGAVAREVETLNAAYAQFVDEKAKELHAAGELSDTYADLPHETRLAAISRETMAVYEQLDVPGFMPRELFDLLRCDAIMDIAESLIGPEVECNPCLHLRAKLPEGASSGKSLAEVPWHQDAAVLLPEADDTLVLTTWIALVDVSKENGTLEVLRGSHRNPILHHHMGNGGIQTAHHLVPEGDAVPYEMPAGSVGVQHCHTLHRSGHNASGNTVRWSIDVRYNDARKPHGRPALPSFLFRSRERPQDVVTDHGHWVERWRTKAATRDASSSYREEFRVNA